MRAFLVLFMVATPAAGGLGFSDAHAGMIYGLYTSMVYLLSFPGGWLADRYLGLQRSVLIGGLLIMSGQISLAVPADPTFYLGLCLVALGTGLLKPNISTLLGRPYEEEDGRRDAGFTIFYMSINLGAFAAPQVCGTWLAQRDVAFIRGWLDSAEHVRPCSGVNAERILRDELRHLCLKEPRVIGGLGRIAAGRVPREDPDLRRAAERALELPRS